jgi:hypothetical protein
MKFIGRKLALPAVGLAMAGGSFAFLASNTVGNSYAGQGQGAIAGYSVSNIHYTFYATGNTQTQQAIHSVTFTLNHPATQVEAIINSPGTANPGTDKGSNDGYYDYANCAPQNGAGTIFTCTYGVNGSSPYGAYDSGQAPMTEATSLTVNASS